MRGRPGLLLTRLAAAALALPLSGVPVRAHEVPAPPVRVEAGSLAAAVARIARATGAEIVTFEPDVRQVTVRGQTLPGDPAKALARLLTGTGYHARRIGPASFRIERSPDRQRHAVPATRPAPVEAEDQPVTVIASKFPTLLRDYPGMVVRQPAGDGSDLPASSRLDDLARRSPTVFATAFGEGRDKLFIRGIADSSFNGASQPTTAVYFDDAPIAFGSPNPNLRLYDIASVEVLEGPQGTLYGGGSLGGVIRITPNPVELDRRSAMASAEASLTQGGQPGGKLGAALNVPLVTGTAGLRVVGYDERQGGFIDLAQGARDVNAVEVAGTRAALAVEPGYGLKVDLGGLYQETHSNDAQYVSSARSLNRTQSTAQPFDSKLVVGRVALRKRWEGGLVFTGVVSLGKRSSFDRFDATMDSAALGATVYDLQRSSSVWAGEARLSRAASNGLNWIVGMAVERIQDGQSRAFGSPEGALALDEVSNITRSASLFAQARWPIATALQATVGLRYTIARTDSEPARGPSVSFIRGATARHFDPTLALLWHPGDRLSLFARFQTGYRNGGVTVARGVGRVADFHPDSIMMGEAGVRLAASGPQGLELAGTISYARWNNVLADQVTRRGTPITTNIGDARLFALEASALWKAAQGWKIGGAILLTDNRLTGDLAMQTPAQNRHLPDTPTLTAQIHTGYEWYSRHGWVRAISASMHYVGRSVLGPGPGLDLSQGNYAVIDTSASMRRGPLVLRIGIDNLFNTRANRFALGNPLLLSTGTGFAPVVPRTVTAGITVAL